ncbi:hypothetical protein Rsub_09665 [Raphidocelis subcapitata]|uniref:Uncharacterized protein n=1 Tax=Raphidocelis subcapitata TaxID=307507 RepID=A0A2V0PBA7_9CHLO|nr:hypothetical protein Rsub_09665 [Raphidocelis subcapitata]|eukprot:GBF96809.1 hypothetical protein Rsub_09665 [Raphidocelis subcapitata]
MLASSLAGPLGSVGGSALPAAAAAVLGVLRRMPDAGGAGARGAAEAKGAVHPGRASAWPHDGPFGLPPWAASALGGAPRRRSYSLPSTPAPPQFQAKARAAAASTAAPAAPSFAAQPALRAQQEALKAHQAPPLPQEQQQQQSSGQPAPAAPQQSALGLPLPALPLRVKGVGRKMLLRQINRTLIRRIARRATIGIPILGVYFVARLLRKDAASLAAHLAARDHGLAALYALAVTAEVADVAAQALITLGMGVSSGLLPAGALPAGLFGFAALPALLAAADRVSLVCAGVSCGAGLTGEGWKAYRRQEGGAGSGADSQDEGGTDKPAA